MKQKNDKWSKGEYAILFSIILMFSFMYALDYLDARPKTVTEEIRVFGAWNSSKNVLLYTYGDESRAGYMGQWFVNEAEYSFENGHRYEITIIKSREKPRIIAVKELCDKCPL